jgi:hypothetical protein
MRLHGDVESQAPGTCIDLAIRLDRLELTRSGRERVADVEGVMAAHDGRGRMECLLCRRSWMLPRQHTVRRQRNIAPCKAEPGAGTIEVEIDGVTVRVGRGADVKTLTTVLRALKTGA